MSQTEEHPDHYGIILIRATRIPPGVALALNAVLVLVGFLLTTAIDDSIPIVLASIIPTIAIAATYKRGWAMASVAVGCIPMAAWLLSILSAQSPLLAGGVTMLSLLGGVLTAEGTRYISKSIQARYDELDRKAQLYATLSQLGQALVDVQDPDDILEAILTHAPIDRQTTSAILVTRYEEGDGQEGYRILRQYDAPQGPQMAAKPFDFADFKRLFASGRLPTVPRVTLRPHITPEAMVGEKSFSYAQAYGVQALAAVHMVEGGTLHGVLILLWGTPHPFSELEITVFQALLPYLTPTVSKMIMSRQIAEEARLRSHIVDSMPNGLVVTDAQGSILTANQKFLTMTGFTRDALQDVNIFDLHSDDTESSADAVWTQEDIVSYPANHLRHDGSTFPARLRLTTLRNVTGLPHGLILSVEDITQQRETELRLQSQARLLENVSDAIIAMDSDLRITSWNQAAERIYGWTEEETRGHSPFELLAPGPVDQETVDGFFAYMDDHDVWTGDVEHRTKSGAPLTISVSISVLRDREGQRQGFVTVNRDITELRETEAALRRTLSNSAALIQAMPDYLFRISRDGDFLEAYIPSTQPTLTIDPIQGRRLVDIMSGSNSAHAAEVQQSIDDAIKTGELQVIESDFQTPQGKRVMETRIVAVDDETALAIVRDITERRRATEQERRQRELAETLRETAATVNSTLDLDAALQVILANLERVIPHDAANFMIIDGDVATIRYARGYEQFGITQDVLDQVTIVLSKEHAIEKMTRMTEPVIINDTANDPTWVESGPPFNWIAAYMGITVRLAGTSQGMLNIDSQYRGFFTEEHARTLRIFAEQVGVALRNAQLYGQLQRKVTELENMRQMILTITAEIDGDRLLESIIASAMDMLQADAGGIYLYEPTRNVLVWSVRVGERLAETGIELTRGEGFSGHIWQTGEAMFVRDYENSAFVMDQFRMGVKRSILGAPILWKNTFLGVVNILIDDLERELTEEEIALVTQFAQHAAVAIHNANMLRETRQNVRQLALLNKLTRLGTTVTSPAELSQAIVESTVRLIEADACTLTLYDQATGTTIAAATAELTRHLGQEMEALSQPLSRSAIELDRTLIIEDVQRSPYLDDEHESLQRLTAMVVLPITLEDEKIGALLIGFDDTHDFDLTEVAAAEQAAELIALAIAKARTYAELEQRVEQRTAELREAAERLRALSRVKDEFVSNVSHELRTPITSIKIYHRLLTARPDKTERYLERLHRETERLEYIIEGMLQLSRLDQHRTHLHMDEVNLADLIEKLTEDRQTLAFDKNITLTSTVETEHVHITADPMLLGQAISIILTNALTYTPEEGRVTLRLIRKGAHVGVIIADTGPGIDPDEREKLFIRFYRGEAGRNSGMPGTGLGLAIAHEIVSRHHGTIEVESTGVAGEGTAFTIWLPA